MSSAADAAPIARKMLDALAAPAIIGPHPISLKASIGIAIYPDDGADAVTLIRHADAAMYRIKRQGSGGFDFYQDDGSTDPGDHLDSEAMPLAIRRTDVAFSEHEARLRELLEANRELVGAAQVAQKLQANAEAAHHRQINFVAMAAHALRNPLSAIRMATSLLSDPRVNATGEGAAAAAAAAPGGADRPAGRRPARRLARRHRRVPAAAARSPARRHPRRRRRRLPPCDRCQAAAAGARGPARVGGGERRSAAPDPGVRQPAQQRLAPLARGRRGDALDPPSTATRSSSPSPTRAPGIAPEVLAGIFDLFAVDTHVPLEESGLGIGLAVVRALAEAHGGSVGAKSVAERSGKPVRRPPAARRRRHAPAPEKAVPPQPSDRLGLVVPERGRRQLAETGPDVVFDVLAPAGAGDGAGHRRMAEHELQQHLGPGAAADAGRPVGQRPWRAGRATGRRRRTAC